MKWQQSCLLHRQGGVEEEEGEEQEGEDWKEGAQVAQEEGEGKHDLPSRFCCWTMEPAAYQEVIGGHPSKKEGTSSPCLFSEEPLPWQLLPKSLNYFQS